jgi:hypothetical protein
VSELSRAATEDLSLLSQAAVSQRDAAVETAQKRTASPNSDVDRKAAKRARKEAKKAKKEAKKAKKAKHDE